MCSWRSKVGGANWRSARADKTHAIRGYAKEVISLKNQSTYDKVSCNVYWLSTIRRWSVL